MFKNAVSTIFIKAMEQLHSAGHFLSSVAFLFLTVLPRRLLKPALKCAVKITAVTEAQP